jgi:hypothetical protein
MAIFRPKLNRAVKGQADIGQISLKVSQRQQLRNIIAVSICDNRAHLLILYNDELKQVSGNDELTFFSLAIH